MSTSNPEATKGYLVKGAVNFDLHNGSVLWFQADGDMLLCVPSLIYRFPNITLAVAPETFLRTVGFTINADTAGVIVSKIFSSTGYIEYSHFRDMVRAIDRIVIGSGGNVEVLNQILERL